MIPSLPNFFIVTIDRKRREVVLTLPVVGWSTKLAPCTPRGTEHLGVAASAVRVLKLPNDKIWHPLFGDRLFADVDELLDHLVEKDLTTAA